jgi:DNA-binding Lrp family transcriptional regulator
MEKEILRLLTKNARMSVEEIADRLSTDSESVATIIKKLEDDNIIKGYIVVVNEEELEEHQVKAMIEVKVTPDRSQGFDNVAKRISKFPEVTNVYLVSGGYDLRIEVVGQNLQEVALFVSSKLSTIDGVISTVTHFLLKKYKQAGVIIHNEEENERLKISP